MISDEKLSNVRDRAMEWVELIDELERARAALEALRVVARWLLTQSNDTALTALGKIHQNAGMAFTEDPPPPRAQGKTAEEAMAAMDRDYPMEREG